MTEYSQCCKNCLEGKSGLNIYREEKNLNILLKINVPLAELLQYRKTKDSFRIPSTILEVYVNSFPSINMTIMKRDQQGKEKKQFA